MDPGKQKTITDLITFLTKEGYPPKVRDTWVDVTMPNGKIALLEVSRGSHGPTVIVAGWGRLKTQTYRADIKGWQQKVLARLQLFV